MNLFKGFFCFIYKRYANEGLFIVALTFVALTFIFLLGLYFLSLPFLELYWGDPLKGLGNNSGSSKLKGGLFMAMTTIPVWLYFKKIKEPYLDEFDKLVEKEQEAVLKRSRYIFYSVFVYFVLMFIISLVINSMFL